MVVFRSILVPLKAAIMNLLSIGAAYGVIVAVFQWGWAKGLVGIDSAVPINPFVPMIMFAILFGLSMDYEVFLLSRVREEFLRTGDSHTSVVDGLASTARVITSAALIMISVFLAFVATDDVTVKMFGLGLATAVFIDATLVRMVLVPSTMSLLGSANWWLPRWLDRILPHMDLEGGHFETAPIRRSPTPRSSELLESEESGDERRAPARARLRTSLSMRRPGASRASSRVARRVALRRRTTTAARVASSSSRSCSRPASNTASKRSPSCDANRVFGALDVEPIVVPERRGTDGAEHAPRARAALPPARRRRSPLPPTPDPSIAGRDAAVVGTLACDRQRLVVEAPRRLRCRLPPRTRIPTGSHFAPRSRRCGTGC